LPAREVLEPPGIENASHLRLAHGLGRDDECAGNLPEAVVRHSDASGIGDLWVVEQNGVDLEQTQLLGAAVDDVVDPALDPVEAGLIAMSEVLGVQPAV